MDVQMQSLFDQKHRLTTKQLEKLVAGHQRQLVRMVKGTAAAPDRTVAMDALVRTAPASARRALSKVVLDRETPTHLRAVAATQLGRVGGKAAEATLLESFAVEKTPLFQIKATAALGKIGTSKSVAMLKKMDRPAQLPALRRQARMGLILVGFREHQKIYTPPIPKEDQLLPPRGALSISFKSERANKRLITSVLGDVRLDSYGIKLSSRTGVRFACMRNQFVMLLNREIEDRDILKEIKRPMIIGLLAQQAPTDASWATRYLLLAWPGSRGRINLSGYRTDGFQVLSGSIESRDKDGLIDMKAVRDGANIPVRLKGLVRGKNISFTELYTEGKVVGSSYLKETVIPTDSD